MSDDMRDKLRRLGLHKGAAHVTRSEPRRVGQANALPHNVHALLDGREVETKAGPAYVVEKHFEPQHLHGDHPLASALEVPGDVLAQLAYDPLGQALDLSRAAFIDTETTGLAGGTGTLVFLVGVGKFQVPSSEFRVTQFFLRHPGEEEAMLAALEEMLADCSSVVTFNGRGFDMPLLQTRFTMNKKFPAILTAPNLDLLLPARRVWRDRLPSCALSSLEANVLNVQRDQADVPGYLIPQMYFDYLKTGDASEMPRVLYHNALDVLSMVTLVARLGRIFADPQPANAPDPADLVSLARWYDDLGMSDKAEATFRLALEQPLPVEVQASAWRRLGLLFKRQDRYEEAARAWEQLAAVDTDIVAHVELAKHYEWRERDLEAALKWTQDALEHLESWAPGLARDQAREELMHRKERLERKSARSESEPAKGENH